MAGERLRHAWLRALGAEEMPASIELADGTYAHLRTFKHDFFAATGLYNGPSGKVILKIGRKVPFFSLPMSWLGRIMADHEVAIYRAVEDLAGVPKCFGRWGTTGFAHAFVPGHPLQRYERVDDEFFPRLAELLARLHERGIAYVDLEKRENILVDDQGRPSLIDFQISFAWPAGDKRTGLQRLIPEELGSFLLARFQDGDRYHLLKHRRRHRPDTLTVEEYKTSYRRGIAGEVHRRLFRPLTLARRTILKALTGRWRSPKQDGPEFLTE